MSPKKPRPDGSNLEDWIGPLNLRGRWGRVSSADKGFIDRDTMQDVAPAFAAEFAIHISDIREGDDPPDISARIGSCSVSIELVELLNRGVREKRAKGQAVSFDEQLWSEATLLAQLNDLLDKKNALYQRHKTGFAADALLIVCCELWLDPSDVRRWLESANFAPRRSIKSAYFVQERLPNFEKPHWPLFRLYGDLSRA